jgi:LemA protein
VQDYNVMIQRFPTNLYAGLLGFQAATYYQIPEGARAVPRVDFNGVGKP